MIVQEATWIFGTEKNLLMATITLANTLRTGKILKNIIRKGKMHEPKANKINTVIVKGDSHKADNRKAGFNNRTSRSNSGNTRGARKMI